MYYTNTHPHIVYTITKPCAPSLLLGTHTSRRSARTLKRLCVVEYELKKYGLKLAPKVAGLASRTVKDTVVKNTRAAERGDRCDVCDGDAPDDDPRGG